MHGPVYRKRNQVQVSLGPTSLLFLPNSVFIGLIVMFCCSFQWFLWFHYHSLQRRGSPWLFCVCTEIQFESRNWKCQACRAPSPHVVVRLSVFLCVSVRPFQSGLIPRLLGDIFSLWICNMLAHFINSYAIDDSVSTHAFDSWLINYFEFYQFSKLTLKSYNK